MTNPVRIHPLKIIFYFLILMSVTFEKNVNILSCHLYPKSIPCAGERDFQSR